MQKESHRFQNRGKAGIGEIHKKMLDKIFLINIYFLIALLGINIILDNIFSVYSRMNIHSILDNIFHNSNSDNLINIKMKSTS